MLRSIVIVALMVLAPASSASPAPASSPPVWDWPVDAPRVIVRQFIAPPTAYASGHRGVDLATENGIVFAPADGVVHFAGMVVDRPVLSIRHPGGLISSYEPVESTLLKGDAVARGDPVGTVLPGHCSDTCLHFGVRLDGEYVSPLLYLGGIEPSVLLPTRR
jgi:murein DD-endopeptidase MepM/ murein hydrolase activator NlpD